MRAELDCVGPLRMYGMDSIRQDTIFALASGEGPTGIAVIRLSGPKCRFVLETISGFVPPPREATLRPVRSPFGEMLDQGIVLMFPGPASFTGEDCAELHLHGGRAIVASVFEALSEFDDVRPAEAGEFTMRAFQNGKVDLTGAEALADLIDAETQEQRRFALLNTGKAHQALYDGWRGRIVEVLAEITAAIDFADEDDVEQNLEAAKISSLSGLADEIDSHMKRYRSGEILRKGYKVAILGAPNVGKSTLLNTLAGRDVAIVTDVPGTTRDVLEVSLELDGRKVVLYDTAGLREADDKIEAIGIERALDTASAADLILFLECTDGQARRNTVPDVTVPIIRIGTKSDLAGGRRDKAHQLVVSAKTQSGLEELIDLLASRAKEAVGDADVVPFRQRHMSLLGAARDALRNAGKDDVEMVELKAEEMRLAAENLGKITGRVDVEDLLDVIFSRFCVGK